MRRVAIYIGLCFAVTLCAEALSAQKITVKVVNGEDGQPLAGQEVNVSFIDPGSDSVKTSTNAQGITEFELPPLRPVYIAVVIHLTSGLWHCGCRAAPKTEQVLGSGYTNTNAFDVRVSSVLSKKALSGEMIFFARPYTTWEKLLHPIVKE